MVKRSRAIVRLDLGIRNRVADELLQRRVGYHVFGPSTGRGWDCPAGALRWSLHSLPPIR